MPIDRKRIGNLVNLIDAYDRAVEMEDSELSKYWLGKIIDYFDLTRYEPVEEDF